MANILVVEDDRYINDVVVRDLKLVGHSCTPVYNGTDAVKTASDNSYDLILLDVLLPGMDGFEVIKHIPRKRQIVPDIAKMDRQIRVTVL